MLNALLPEPLVLVYAVQPGSLPNAELPTDVLYQYAEAALLVVVVKPFAEPPVPVISM